MKKPFRAVAVALVAGLSLSACADMQNSPKTSVGTLAGAGLGGLLGAQFGSGTGKLVGVGLGTVVGALVGRGVGESLDRADRQTAARNAEQSLESRPSGSVSTWQNPDNGTSGTFQPTRTYETAEGRFCREYQQTVTVGGKTQQAYGTACRQADGSWKVENQS